MKIEFNFEKITLTEFGIGRDDDNGKDFVILPVDGKIQDLLQSMAKNTWEAMKKNSNTINRYDPSDKHASIEYLYLELSDDQAANMRALYQSSNLPIDTKALDDASKMSSYFVRMKDAENHILIGLRRATQFKGAINSRGRIVRWLNDTLKIVENTIFKLDTDFDLLIDAQRIHILRPSGFEALGQLKQAILDAVSKNLSSIKESLPFVNFDGIEEYAKNHLLAARYLASIRGQGDVKDIDKDLLKERCNETGVELLEAHGRISIPSGSEMSFLEVLDRRLYSLELVKNKPERFVARSRKARK